MTQITSRIAGSFSGYHDGAIFKLSNGQVWQQRRYKYKYKYKYRPTVTIYDQQGRKIMRVDCMDEEIEVVRVSELANGAIVSDFTGFMGGSRFELQNGGIWEQAEYKYSYHYAYRPDAVVVDALNGPTMYVDGMSETVKVRRVA